MSAPTTRAPEQSEMPANGGHLPTGAKATPAQPKRIAPQQMTGAQAVIRSLEELDVDVVFGIPGGAVLP
ncbi:MAG: acetolactate synthase large subunit, partial [Mycobacterium sp.]|nr:acetolactate synthase large subunit [Mycobacterium sp.]